MTDIAAGSGRLPWLAWLAALRAWLFLAILAVFFEVWARIAYGTTFFGNSFNLQSIAVFTVAPLLLALGQTFVIISGGIDLSVGFTMGLAAVVVAHVANAAGHTFGPTAGFIAAILVALPASAVPGLINGWLVARLGIPPFIGTLGMYGVARGAAFLIAGGTAVPVANPLLADLGSGSLLGVPLVVLVAVAVVAGMHYLLSETRYGQYTYAIGGNREAAVRAGIRVGRMTLLLDSIAAVVIGGASLFGGSGTVIGTVIGALIIAVIQYGLVFVDVEPFWQFIAVGIVIIISVVVDQSQKRLGARDLRRA